jgi:hypothetical protein
VYGVFVASLKATGRLSQDWLTPFTQEGKNKKKRGGT